MEKWRLTIEKVAKLTENSLLSKPNCRQKSFAYNSKLRTANYRLHRIHIFIYKCKNIINAFNNSHGLIKTKHVKLRLNAAKIFKEIYYVVHRAP